MSAARPHAGRWVEIAGVAGAGKSALRAALCDDHDGWLSADSLHTRRREHFPYLAAALPAVAPMALASARHGTWPQWQDVKDALYVSAWQRYLAAHADKADRTVILDQGPLFALARLQWMPSPLTSAPGFASWWAAALTRWSGELDAVVWVEAPDDVLLDRINARTQAHQIKNRPRDEALAFLATSHWRLAEVVDAVCATAGIPILAIDTDDCTPGEAAQQVAEWLGPHVAAPQ